ncbi:WcaF family extracellular polysaccharide biosynthesis acetyltransferase [Arcticibacterium luteifluviistationis]|uniref:Colanic acid biosynthesis acetyltransferase WcaF n=1 Tax=Arcticibacterium luteifluviistationis TaxID=1784714 RepID=A0A2Z4GB90_9BACT|nr:WcaF family extracellular polysaccharide biosynthesis acetyltransferase [Arcticibacterium luteifluviistationis]AWV98404.1 colanic acid biosynthesis acetyltransferase WcaF [Arcticibacterium luteifluviistationis]
MNKVDLSKYDNSWYNHGPLYRRLLWLLFGRIFINTYFPIPTKFKIIVLRVFGAKMGENIMIKPKVNIKYPWLLEVGDNTWIGEQVWIDNLDFVKVGTNVCLSQGVMLLTGNHDYKSRKFDLMVGKITLEDGVWIGAKSLVAPGVICHEHSVLGAASLLSKSLPSNEIWSGNPAIFLRNRIIE